MILESVVGNMEEKALDNFESKVADYGIVRYRYAFPSAKKPLGVFPKRSLKQVEKYRAFGNPVRQAISEILPSR